MSQVAAPADKRFRRAHVKPARQRRWRGIVRQAVVAGLVLAGLLAAAYRGTAAVAQARMLQIDRITVAGNQRVPSSTVLDAVDGLKGESLVWTDLEAWRQRLLQSPWVREATFRRSLPSTIEIEVVERQPALIARIGSRLYLMDEDGLIIDTYGPRYVAFDLPIVDGLSATNPAPGVRADADRAHLAARVVASLRAAPELGQRISQIDVADPHNAQVMLTDDPAVLYLGEDRFQQRVESYLQLAETFRATVPDIAYVDLRFGERVFVGPLGKGRRTPVSLPMSAAGGSRTQPSRRPTEATEATEATGATGGDR